MSSIPFFPEVLLTASGCFKLDLSSQSPNEGDVAIVEFQSIAKGTLNGVSPTGIALIYRRIGDPFPNRGTQDLAAKVIVEHAMNLAERFMALPSDVAMVSVSFHGDSWKHSKPLTLTKNFTPNGKPLEPVME